MLPQVALMYAASSGGQALDPGGSVSVFFLAAALAPMMLAPWLGPAPVIAARLHLGSWRAGRADRGQDRTDGG